MGHAHASAFHSRVAVAEILPGMFVLGLVLAFVVVRPVHMPSVNHLAIEAGSDPDLLHPFAVSKRVPGGVEHESAESIHPTPLVITLVDFAVRPVLLEEFLVVLVELTMGSRLEATQKDRRRGVLFRLNGNVGPPLVLVTLRPACVQPLVQVVRSTSMLMGREL